MRNALTTLGLGTQMLILLTLFGCSARAPVTDPERTGCELNLNAVCAVAIENYAAAEAERSTHREPADGAHLVPLVLPVALTGGDGTAELDCLAPIPKAPGWSTRTKRCCPSRQRLGVPCVMKTFAHIHLLSEDSFRNSSSNLRHVKVGEDVVIRSRK